MNAIQKAAFAASALAITVLGTLFVTAPMVFAHGTTAAARSDCSATSLPLTLAGRVDCRVTAATQD